MSLSFTSDQEDEKKKKKKNGAGVWLVTFRKRHACHGIVCGFWRPVIRFGVAWKTIVRVIL